MSYVLALSGFVLANIVYCVHAQVQEPHVWIYSFGATRTLKFTHNSTGAVVELKMTDGSVFVMGPKTNANWKHEVPLEPEIKEPRISVIFRHITTTKDIKMLKCRCAICSKHPTVL